MNLYQISFCLLIIQPWILPGQVFPQTTSTAPAEWSAEAFAYKRPNQLVIEKIKKRPYRRVAGTRQEIMTFENTDGEKVSVLVTMPSRGNKPFPVVILAHGFTSDKVQVTRRISRPLTEYGFACVALDFPKHGDRKGNPRTLFIKDDPRASYQNIIRSIIDIRQTIDFAEQHEALDASSGVALIGYSMGSWFSTLAGAADVRIKALVLMVAGSAVMTEHKPQAERDAPPGLLDMFIDLRPDEAIPHFAPRPVLLQNGKNDRLVPEERAKKLFNAAKKPKEHRWYSSGHILTKSAYEYAAYWLKKNLKNQQPKNNR